MSAAPQDRPKPQYPIESVDNALRLILMYRNAPSLRVTDAAEALGVAVSTAYRLLAMLQYHGFVEQPHGSKAYVAGPSLKEIGLAVVDTLDLPGIARPVLERLVAEVEETAHLVVLEGDRSRFVDTVESPRTVRVIGRAGQSLAAHTTAGGKAMLAGLDPGLFYRLYPDEELDGDGGARSIATRSDLEAEILHVQSVGYATNQMESEDGVSAVGMSIVDSRGVVRGALSVSAPSERLAESQVPVVVPALRRAVDSIVQQLV